MTRGDLDDQSVVVALAGYASGRSRCDHEAVLMNSLDMLVAGVDRRVREMQYAFVVDVSIDAGRSVEREGDADQAKAGDED